MRKGTWGVVAGLIVLGVGVFSIAALLGSADNSVEPQAVAPIVAPAATPPETAPTSTTPGLPGVPTRIARVLAWNGDATFASSGELAQLPPSVAAVLSAYDVPLQVPLTETGK